MGEEVEHRHRIDAHACGHEHVAQLRAGGIGDHALDIPLRGANRSGKQAGGSADEGDEAQRRGLVPALARTS